jgi:hypothetical protein
MVRVRIDPDSVKLWLSESDTYWWANRPGESWPGSTLEGHRVFAEFDSNGLLDLTVDGEYLEEGEDIDSNEFNAITSDFLEKRLPKNHPAWLVTVGQFRGAI